MAPAILILTLLVADSPVPVGQPVPVAIKLRNISDRPVWVTYVLDGSEERARYPYVRAEVTQDGITVAEPPAAEDPLVSPLRPEDFRLLQPGEAFDPIRPQGIAGHVPLFTFLNFRPEAPGTYEFSVTYSTESPSPENWLGGFGQDDDRDAVLSRIADIPHITLTASATVTVR